jgi:hypothetical protein
MDLIIDLITITANLTSQIVGDLEVGLGLEGRKEVASDSTTLLPSKS